MPSVIEARMKMAEARISRSPVCSAEKRGVQRIQIRSGIAAMRVSVMELGRLTRCEPTPQGRSPVIILYIRGQGNGQKDIVPKGIAELPDVPAGKKWRTCNPRCATRIHDAFV